MNIITIIYAYNIMCVHSYTFIILHHYDILICISGGKRRNNNAIPHHPGSDNVCVPKDLRLNYIYSKRIFFIILFRFTRTFKNTAD